MAMSKGTYHRKMKRIARMKDADRAAQWRARVEGDFGAGDRGVLARGARLVEGALAAAGRAVRGVGSALLGGSDPAPEEASRKP